MDRSSKNKEILENPKVKALLEAGHVVCIDVKDTKNDSIKSVCLMSYVEGLSNSSVNDLKAALMNWTRSPERCIESVNAAIIEGLNSEDSFTTFVQDKLNFTPAIQIEDGFKSTYDGESPRATRDGELLVCAETGKEVYRKKTIVPANSVNHNTKKVMVQSDYEETNTSVTADQLVSKNKEIAV